MDFRVRDVNFKTCGWVIPQQQVLGVRQLLICPQELLVGQDTAWRSWSDLRAVRQEGLQELSTFPAWHPDPSWVLGHGEGSAKWAETLFLEDNAGLEAGAPSSKDFCPSDVGREPFHLCGSVCSPLENAPAFLGLLCSRVLSSAGLGSGTGGGGGVCACAPREGTGLLCGAPLLKPSLMPRFPTSITSTTLQASPLPGSSRAFCCVPAKEDISSPGIQLQEAGDWLPGMPLGSLSP